jgi:hypothetical protein
MAYEGGQANAVGGTRRRACDLRIRLRSDHDGAGCHAMLQANALFIAWAPRPELLQEYADCAGVIRAVLIYAFVGCPCPAGSAAC